MKARPVQQVDCLIIGGGLIGASLALALQHKNMSVVLVEQSAAVPECNEYEYPETVESFDPRVSALTLQSQGFLKTIGAWAQVPEHSRGTYTGMHVWDECGTGHIEFDAQQLAVPQLGSIVENRVVLAAVYQSLLQAAKVKLMLGKSVKHIQPKDKAQQEQMPLLEAATELGQSCEVSLSDGSVFEAQLVVAADGGESRTRKKANIPLVSWDYDHAAIVCTVKTERKHEWIARQRFSETGPIAFLPLNDSKQSEQFCSIVWSNEPEAASDLMGLDSDTFGTKLEEAIEGQLGGIIEISKRYKVPLKMRHAKRYFEQNIVLVGDAAHTIHPLAGQGVNLGFADVQALIEQIDFALEHRIELNEPVLLKRYQRARMGDNVLMTSSMEAFKRLFGEPDPGVRWLRNVGLDWVNRQQPIKQMLAKKALGLS